MHIFSSDEADYDSYADYNEDVRNGKKLDKQEPWTKISSITRIDCP